MACRADAQLIFLDKDGTVIRPAILWNDTRTTKQCYEIESLVGSACFGGSVQPGWRALQPRRFCGSGNMSRRTQSALVGFG